MSEKRLIVTNTAAAGVAQIVTILASLVFMPLLIQEFGKGDYGVFVIVTSIAGWVALLDFGVGASLVKMISEKLARDDRESIGDLVSAGLLFYIMIGLVVAALLVVLAFSAGAIFTVTPHQELLLRNMLLVAAVFALWNWPANTALYVLGGFQRYTITARVQLGVTLGTVAAYIAVLRLNEGPLMLFGAVSSMMALGALANVLVVRRELKGIAVSPSRAQRLHLKTIFSFSWAIFLVQLSTVILYQNTDRLILGIFIGTAVVALYDPIAKFQSLVVQLVSLTNAAVIPMASHLDASRADEKIRQLFLRGTKYALVLVAPAIVVLIVLARDILLQWMGPEFASQATNARILLLPHLLIVGGVIGDSIITGRGRLSKRLPYSMAMTAANLVLSVVLVQRIGILGVVLGTAIPYLVDYPLHMRLLLRETGVSARAWAREVLLPVYPLLLLPAAVCFAGLRTSLSGSLVGLGLIGAASIAAYLLAVFALGLNQTERREIRSISKAIVGRIGG